MFTRSFGVWSSLIKSSGHLLWHYWHWVSSVALQKQDRFMQDCWLLDWSSKNIYYSVDRQGLSSRKIIILLRKIPILWEDNNRLVTHRIIFFQYVYYLPRGLLSSTRDYYFPKGLLSSSDDNYLPRISLSVHRHLTISSSWSILSSANIRTWVWGGSILPANVSGKEKRMQCYWILK